MMTPHQAGYSQKPLVAKLGYVAGCHVWLSGAPDHIRDLLSADPDGRTIDTRGSDRGYDAAHVFLTNPAGIADTAAAAISRLRPGAMLWLSWAKKSSALHSGVTEDLLREAVLPLGWVDVKVCAVDADWSGLKFLKRKTPKQS